jgi:cytochrome c oxidase subunit 3
MPTYGRSSLLVFFFSVFWAFFHSALAPTVELGTEWPPAGIEAVDPMMIPLLNGQCYANTPTVESTWL